MHEYFLSWFFIVHLQLCLVNAPANKSLVRSNLNIWICIRFSLCVCVCLYVLSLTLVSPRVPRNILLYLPLLIDTIPFVRSPPKPNTSQTASQFRNNNKHIKPPAPRHVPDPDRQSRAGRRWRHYRPAAAAGTRTVAAAYAPADQPADRAGGHECRHERAVQRVCQQIQVMQTPQHSERHTHTHIKHSLSLYLSVSCRSACLGHMCITSNHPTHNLTTHEHNSSQKPNVNLPHPPRTICVWTCVRLYCSRICLKRLTTRDVAINTIFVYNGVLGLRLLFCLCVCLSASATVSTMTARCTQTIHIP